MNQEKLVADLHHGRPKMNATDYQHRIKQFDLYPDDRQFEAYALGLCSEAGEVAGKVKKWIRQDGTLHTEDVAEELGDVLWYLSRMASYLHFGVEEILALNFAKLTDRANRNKIQGDGDKR